jgi:hypothetical protein
LFGLETDQFHWREVPYLGIEFKRLSSSKNALWALGGDHQLYVRLFGVEVPIRVKEVGTALKLISFLLQIQCYKIRKIIHLGTSLSSLLT